MFLNTLSVIDYMTMTIFFGIHKNRHIVIASVTRCANRTPAKIKILLGRKIEKKSVCGFAPH